MAAMNKDRMLHSKISYRPIETNIFQEFINKLNDICIEVNLLYTVLIMDDGRFHHSKLLNFMDFRKLYSPFLNSIENAFSRWKNLVNRAGSRSREDLLHSIRSGFINVTPNDCNGYWMNMRKYLRRSQNREIITD